MNAAAALRAYARVSLAGRGPREIEAEVLIKANGLLKGAPRLLPDFRPYAEALRFNQSFWTIVQVDVSSPDNALPASLRENLLRLGLFVDRQTRLAFSEPKSEHLQALIDINRHLIEGLLGRPSELGAVRADGHPSLLSADLRG